MKDKDSIYKEWLWKVAEGGEGILVCILLRANLGKKDLDAEGMLQAWGSEEES